MRQVRSADRAEALGWRRGGVSLLLLALATQAGCTREFFREWANQDVSEAVFEKSRDPRWRIDLFSPEPPALARFADPFDQDVPPAPPDDPASEALSPVPQWPDTRVLVPYEGTGYLDLLEFWRRQEDARNQAQGKPTTDVADPGNIPNQPPGPPPSASPFVRPGPGGGSAAPPAAVPSAPRPAGPPPGAQAWNHKPARVGSELAQTVIRLQSAEASGPVTNQPARTGSAGQPAPISGTRKGGSTPISLSRTTATSTRPTIPPPRSAAAFSSVRTQGTRGVKDRSVSRASVLVTGAPAGRSPAQDARAAAQPVRTAGAGMTTERLELVPPIQERPVQPGQLPPPTPPQQPLSPDVIAEIGKMGQEQAAELSGILVPRVTLQTDEEGYGYERGSRPYKINMQQALALALINSRFYQFNVEQIYLTALPVTLQRFAFAPQFYAGWSTVTSVPQTYGSGLGPSPSAATPGVNTSNNFTYATRFAPSGQLSNLNIGTVAGFGKLFSSGGQLLMGFANEVAFNFIGRNPQQPTVFSALPISFVQPFLRGAGRAVTLEPLTQAERTLLYAVRTFTLFRQQFFVVTLTGGQIQNFGQGFLLQGFSIPGNTDPTVGFIPVVFNLVEVEVDRRNIAFLENVVKLYEELIQGESSGLSRLQVDQTLQRLILARQAFFGDKLTYRTSLDSFRMQLGIPPDTPVIVDMSLAQPFYNVFNAVDAWQRRADRKLDELPEIIAKIPVLEDIVVEGRSVLAPYRNYESTRKVFIPETEQNLEDTLQAAVRIALEYRMDLMNARAQLYDFWRQIRVTSNALRGVFNVALSNNIYTPVGNTNPFGFLSEAKNFSLVLNAELPLVRVSERNNFRQALINYQRTRRSLQGLEDNLKIQLRNDLRQVHLGYINYEISKRNFELNVRLKDQAFEQIIAPPAGGTQALAQTANAAAQTTNLLNFQQQMIQAQLALTNGWQFYQTQRLIVYRDIGILPYDEWEAFSELFPSEYHGPIIGHAAANGPPGFTPPPAAAAASGLSR
jgi:hypothetical protein